MTVLGGFLGAVAGFAIGIVFTEVIFVNSADWPNVVPFGLAVFGWLVGTSSVRRLRAGRRPAH
jgi:hypothetical protein